MKAVFTLKSAESRRLLAKAVAKMPSVQKAYSDAYILLANGTTSAFIAQELFGIDGINPERCTVGTSTSGVICVTDPDKRDTFVNVFHKGVPKPDMTLNDALNDFDINTVVIKGANAVDPDGNVGIITAGFDGGTVQRIIGTVTSTGLQLISVVGLEKLVSSVREACRFVGARRLDHSMGADFGMYDISTSTVVTEIEAMNILFGLRALHIASGGVGGNGGAVVIAVEGDKEAVEEAVNFIETQIKGEPAIPENKGNCETCRYFRCRYNGYKNGDLPFWLQ